MKPFRFSQMQHCFSQSDIKQQFENMHFCIGFVTAIASSPEIVPPEEWLAQLVLKQDTDIPRQQEIMPFDEAANELIEWWDYCIFVFDNGETLNLPNKIGLTPKFKPNKALLDFSKGYLEAFDWLYEVWKSFLPEDDDNNQEAIRTLSVLNFILTRFIDEPAMAEQEPELYQQLPDTKGCFETLEMLVSGVGMLGQDLATDALLEDQLIDEEPVANPFRNVGRNDQCPCGSGKKFKKCCLH